MPRPSRQEVLRSEQKAVGSTGWKFLIDRFVKWRDVIGKMQRGFQAPGATTSYAKRSVKLFSISALV